MRTLSSFSKVHLGETILVCGCGQSLNELEHPELFITIGVNDIGRRFHPNYLVVLNPPEQFSGDRFRYVESSQAQFLFTQLDLGLKRDNLVRFSLGVQGGTDFSKADQLNYTQNSPYVALCLAVHMGAKRIGLIGVDFADHHFFAATGIHSLSSQLPAIDEQYRLLHEAIKSQGAEVFNLSRTSRLQALPKLSLKEFESRADTITLAQPDNQNDAQSTVVTGPPSTLSSRTKLFVVNYNFLTCGEVFGAGLRNAAEELGVTCECALWDDAALPGKLEAFQPDLILVVHGRRFAQKWNNQFSQYQTAVWLVDEPYEVDDTAHWSGTYQTVFINDPSTLTRHSNAHYLPVCFDSAVHRDPQIPRTHRVGFIGGCNETRNRYLDELARAGLLSYVVGGPWKSPAVQRLSLGAKISPTQTAELYQRTEIVVNLFRDIHHFNCGNVSPHSLNPRIYEALACGALVVSETRPELAEVFPNLPAFTDARSLVSTVRELLSSNALSTRLLSDNRARLNGHSYADRLATVLEVCLGWMRSKGRQEEEVNSTILHEESAMAKAGLDGWIDYGKVAEINSAGDVTCSKTHDCGPGSERGLASAQPFAAVELSFDLWLDENALFVAKIHQEKQLDQASNSYHLMCGPGLSYAARHNCVFGRLPITRRCWQSVVLRRVGQSFEVSLGGHAAIKVTDSHLRSGYCFVGVKGGRAELRNLKLVNLSGELARKPAAMSLAKLSSSCSGKNGNGHLPAPGSEQWPFTETPKRNLIYHIWPVPGQMWKWNLAQLLQRLEVFNGRRVMSIVHDERSLPPEEVQEAVAGHGFEFVIAENDERGEAITFAEMMQRVASDDPNEVTFYGHAKGVKYEPNIPVPIRRWSQVQYQVALDDWLTVREQLERYAMTGPFKRLGRFTPHRNLADWHYSGTYFWMRHSQVFARNYKEIPQFYGGVETWPGTVFRRDETACLFIDNLGPNRAHHPYYPEFWRQTAELAFHRWQTTVRSFPPPTDLIDPRPYKGDLKHRMEQKPEEFEWWLDLLVKTRTARVLTIGSSGAGVEWTIARKFFEHGLPVEITAIKTSAHPGAAETFQEAEQCFNQTLKLIATATPAATLRAQLAEQYDAIFIDGDHSYKGCRSDFEFALSLRPKIIGLHDIVDSDWHTYTHCCVSRLWRELSETYRTLKKSSGEWGGIGVVLMDLP
jgi:hypothetical protein